MRRFRLIRSTPSPEDALRAAAAFGVPSAFPAARNSAEHYSRKPATVMAELNRRSAACSTATRSQSKRCARCSDATSSFCAAFAP